MFWYFFIVKKCFLNINGKPVPGKIIPDSRSKLPAAINALHWHN